MMATQATAAPGSAAGGPVSAHPALQPQREHVALLHGFLAHSLLLSPLGIRLRRHGYRTAAWGYWNMRCSISVHARRFEQLLRRLDADPAIDTVHLVAHSMGGIIARAALGCYLPRKMGRFVMLAPPNRGSFMATTMTVPLGWLFQPIVELSTAEDSFVNRLPTPQGIQIGVIAAEWDALVERSSTHPDAPHAHASLPCLHSSLLFRRDAAALVAAFLRHGTFRPGATQPDAAAASADGVRA